MQQVAEASHKAIDIILKQGLRQDSEAPTINEQTIQSVDKAIMQ